MGCKHIASSPGAPSAIDIPAEPTFSFLSVPGCCLVSHRMRCADRNGSTNRAKAARQRNAAGPQPAACGTRARRSVAAPLDTGSPITRQQAANRRSKRGRAQLEAGSDGNPSSSSQQDSSTASSASSGQNGQPEVPVAKRTRAALALSLPSSSTQQSSETQLGQQQHQQRKQRRAGRIEQQPEPCPCMHGRAAEIIDNPHKREHLPEVLSAMLELGDDSYQLLALDAALAVDRLHDMAMLEPFLANQQLILHTIQLIVRSKVGVQEDEVAQAAHTVLCLLACRAVKKSAAAAADVLQCLTAQEQQGLQHLLQLLPSNDNDAAHLAMGAIASLAATARFAPTEPAALSVVQQLYSTAIQQQHGLQLLLEALQQDHLKVLAALAVEGFAQVVPHLLLADLLSQQQRRGMQFLMDSLDTSTTGVSVPVREAVYLLLVAAGGPQFQQLLWQLFRQAQRHCCVAAMQLIVLAGVHAGPAALVPHARLLLQLLEQQGGSQDFKQYIIRALQQVAQSDGGQHVLVHHGIPPLLYAMGQCEVDTAVAAASLMCVLAGSVAGRAALVPHIRGLLEVAVKQRRSDITAIAVQCVGAILVFGSMGADGSLLLSPHSPGLAEIVDSIELVLAVMHYWSHHEQGNPPQQQQQEQQGADQPQQQQQDQAGDQLQEQEQGADEPQQQAQQPPAGDQQQQQQQPGGGQPLLQIRPCAAVSAAMIINAVAVSPQGAHVLQQERFIDILLSVVQRRSPAATLAARAVSQVIAAVPASRHLLTMPDRLAIVNELAADVPKIAELGARAAGAAPAAGQGIFAAAVAVLAGDEQDVAVDVFKVAGPLVHLLAACAVCGVVPQYVDGLARLIHKIPCLTMVLFEALTQLTHFREGLLALAPHIHWIVAAVHRSMRNQAESAGAAGAAAGAGFVAAVRASLDKPAAERAVRSMVNSVRALIAQIKQEHTIAECRVQYGAVQVAQAMKRYRRWPRSRKLQATAVLLLQQLGKLSEQNRRLKKQLWLIKYTRQAAGYRSIRQQVSMAMASS